MKRAELLIIVLLSASSCEQNPVYNDIPSSYTPSYQWRNSPLQSQNIDSVRIDSAVTSFSMNENLYSLIVIRNGFLVKEFYQPNHYFYNEFELRSATKSIVSALVGIALDRGLIDSLDQPMISFFPEYDSPDLDPRTRKITIRHLLMMRAGFDFNELDPPPYIDSPTTERVRAIIKLPLKYDPGERFYYTSVQTHLLSAIITKRSGLSTAEFGRKYLFAPAQINIGYWSKDPQGIQTGGTGLLMTPRDMARFGYLYLNNGTIDSLRIVPKTWVEQSKIPNNAANSVWGEFTSMNYGFSWWTNYTASDSIFFAAGFGGQCIIIIPAKNAVIVTAANPNQPTDIIGRQEDEIIRIITQYVIPSFQ